ncbi:MAG TPA: TerC family protein [Cytophagaceae bacterium]|nr:TerC family protein [Cytophagaceae bacterium]
MILLDNLLSVGSLLSFLTLTVMEIVLGIDNIIFISILSNRIEPIYQNRVRVLGLSLALVVRLILLGLLTKITHVEKSLFTIAGIDFAIKQLIFLAGGLFLIYKSTTEIHASISGDDDSKASGQGKISIGSAIIQIILLDLVFSFDSILTAVGLSGEMIIMSLAVFISMLIMLFASKGISTFIHGNPTVKVLALSFLMTIGIMLVAEAFHKEIPKGYIYYSLAFSLAVEMLNLRAKKKKASEKA